MWQVGLHRAEDKKQRLNALSPLETGAEGESLILLDEVDAQGDAARVATLDAEYHLVHHWVDPNGSQSLLGNGNQV